MKIEFDPNELTIAQRNHVAEFVKQWPDLTVLFKGADNVVPNNATNVIHDEFGTKAFIPTGEQRLRDEQVDDLEAPTPTNNVKLFTLDHLNANLPVEAYQPTVVVKPAPSFADVAASLTAPPPHVPTSVPSAPTVAPVTGSPVALDKEGLPWDARIHSSSKAFIADGTWKLRRGVDQAEVATVKAQLRELMNAPVASTNVDLSSTVNLSVTAISQVPDTISMPVAPPPPKSHYLIDQVNPTHAAPDAITIPPPPKSHYLIDQAPTVTITDLIKRMSAAIAEGRLTKAQVHEACNKHGVAEFHLLGNRPDLIPLVDADMKALGV